MALPVRRTDPAEQDLLEIFEYLEQKSPAAAARIARKIEERCRALGQFPGTGRSREEIAPGLRSVVVEKYVLFFRATAEEILIIRILHGARNLEAILKEETEPPE